MKHFIVKKATLGWERVTVRLTKEDRLDRLVKKTRQRVDQIPASAKLLKHMPRSKLRVLVREAGYKRSSRKLLDRLSDRLREEGIEFSPELMSPENTPDTVIRFFDAKRPVKGVQPARELFRVEAELERFLWNNKHFLSQATKHLKLTDYQRTLAPGVRPDMVAEDTKSGELVGIELKVGEPDQGIVAQASKYMKALKAQAEAENRKGARLLIITGQANADLAALVQAESQNLGVKCDWLLYRVRFELNQPS